MKQLQTDNQKKRMWRDAAIRKEFKELVSGNSAKTAAHKYLADKHKLKESMIRIIIANKRRSK